MSIISYILWNVNPEIVSGWPPRWYGLLFASGFLLSQQVLLYIFGKEFGNSKEGKKKADEYVNSLTVYLVIATIVGARLGHVLFYEPARYLSDPLAIFKIWEGGLASHGAALGLFTALWLFARKKKLAYMYILDRVAIVVALTGCLIRFGNFMNSEIYGHPTTAGIGTVFGHNVEEYITGGANNPIIDFEINRDNSREPNGYKMPITLVLTFQSGTDEASATAYLDNQINRQLTHPYVSEHIDEPLMHNLDFEVTQLSDGLYGAVIKTWGIARHPTQLYESTSNLIIFALLMWVWNRKKEMTDPGRIFGPFLIVLFTLRFLYEFVKVNQVAFEENIALNMGQILSIPLVIWGIVVTINSFKRQKS